MAKNTVFLGIINRDGTPFYKDTPITDVDLEHIRVGEYSLYRLSDDGLAFVTIESDGSTSVVPTSPYEGDDDEDENEILDEEGNPMPDNGDDDETGEEPDADEDD